MLSPFPWFGGKWYFLKYLLPFPKHIQYMEVFGGGGSVLLNKIPSGVEVYNDIHSRLVNAWKVLQHRWVALKLRAETEIEHRDLFKAYREPSDHAVEDAFRFFYVARYGFSGTKSYAGLTRRPDTREATAYHRAVERFEEIHERIKYVHFENQDFHRLLQRALDRWDTRDACLYLDPPYFRGGESYETKVQEGATAWLPEYWDDLWEICQQFDHARVIVSIDREDVLPGWHVSDPIVRYNFAARKDVETSEGVEWILRNYPPGKTPVMSKGSRALSEFL